MWSTRCVIPLSLALSLFCFLLLLLRPAPAVAVPLLATTHTVCTAGPPTCDHSTIQAAVDAAGEGDLIKVAEGVYNDIHARPRADVDNTGVVSQVVYLDKSVTIRGGYAAPAFADPSAPTLHQTILDAQGQGRVLYVTGAITPTVDGMILKGGYTAQILGEPYFEDDNGGGVYVITAALTLANCQVIENCAPKSGGGIFMRSSNTRLLNDVIADNDVFDWGLGSGLAAIGNVTVEDSTIMHNCAEEGGGAWVANGVHIFNRNIITRNFARLYGGGVYAAWASTLIMQGNQIVNNEAGHGGGVKTFRHHSAQIRNNTFLSNTAGADGGGAYLLGSDTSLIANRFSGNVGFWGGGLIIDTSDAFVVGNDFSDNVARRGGGLTIYRGGSQLVNNLVTDNHVTESGSGIYLWDTGQEVLVHNTIAQNTGGDGAGIAVEALEPSAPVLVFLTNTVIVSQAVGITTTLHSTVTLESTLWHGNGTDWRGDGVVLNRNARTGAPDFLDPWPGGYRLGPHSAAIDAGVDAGVTTDIDGWSRPYLAPDLGAYEYWPRAAINVNFLPLVHRSD